MKLLIGLAVIKHTHTGAHTLAS